MRILTILITLIALTACAGKGLYSKGYYSGKSGQRPQDVHVVRAGETLYSIAFQYGQDYREVARWNNIDSNFTIFPEQKILITKPDNYQPKNSFSDTKVNKPIKPTSVVKSNPDKHVPVSKKVRNGSHILSWQWPAKGPILNHFSANDPGLKGISIGGQKSSPVYAAEAGQVVYSGSGLRGYGKLIIIKHNETFLSAYAHNNRLRVRDGEKVKKGERIADMGNTGTNRVKLHFEIRRNGTPVNPLKYLPR